MSTLNNNLVKGSDVLLWMKGADDETEKTLGFSSSMTISLSGEASTVSNKSAGNGWQSNILTSRSWTASSDAVYAIDVYTTESSYADLYDAYINGTSIELSWGCDQNAGLTTGRIADVDDSSLESKGWQHKASTVYYKGSAIITSLELTASNDDSATFSVEFTGNGAITKVTAPAKS